MYESILEGIAEARKLNLDSLLLHLDSLKPAARSLYWSYQTQQIEPEYRFAEVQECYMLRYYPVYSQLIYEELCRVVPNGSAQGSVVASFFGCGPAPELYGLLQYLSSRCEEGTTVEARLYDLNANAWTYARNLADSRVLPDVWSREHLSVTSVVADFTSDAFLQGYADLHSHNEKPEIVVFQNCLNEIHPGREEVTFNNVCELLAAAAPGSLAIFIDQAQGKYWSSDVMLANFREFAVSSQGVSIFSDLYDGVYDCRYAYDHIPSIIEGRPFYLPQEMSPEMDGLMLRKKIQYSSLVLQNS